MALRPSVSLFVQAQRLKFGRSAALGKGRVMVAPEPPSEVSTASNEQPTRQSAHKISWDEEIIAEHDKERGTRMKVQEPETP